MIRRIPIFATLIVIAAVAIMIRFGIWQLGRAGERDAAKAEMIARSSLPGVEFPYSNPTNPRFAYRRVMATCDEVRSWEARGGRSADGTTGWRHIATCVAGKPNVLFQADMGVSRGPNIQLSWAGGEVIGHAVRAPDNRSLVEKLLRKQVPRPLMLVAETPAPGLAPSRQPDPREEENSSWSYAGQWFLFALTALAIYSIALWKRMRAR